MREEQASKVPTQSSSSFVYFLFCGFGTGPAFSTADLDSLFFFQSARSEEPKNWNEKLYMNKTMLVAYDWPFRDPLVEYHL